MYADDTTLYCNLNETTPENLINYELTKITDWLCSNKLSLNVKKTKYMVYHTSQRKVAYPTLTINHSNIDRVTKFNFLGVILSYNLKWDKHINYISQKISRIIGVMHRLKYIYPRHILFRLYNTLIIPHFTYSILVWGSKIVPNHSIHLYFKRKH